VNFIVRAFGYQTAAFNGKIIKFFMQELKSIQNLDVSLKMTQFLPFFLHQMYSIMFTRIVAGNYFSSHNKKQDSRLAVECKELNYVYTVYIYIIINYCTFEIAAPSSYVGTVT
jgi:hypothetical protein